ncbi:MAG: DUF3795 domain-containing protein [Methanoregula sp.]|jgi:hypothetical protein
MDVKEMTAPCGLDCFNCPCYLANDNDVIRKQIALQLKERGLPSDKVTCRGCRKENGICPLGGMRTEPCKAYKCVSSKGIESCADCSDFPCDNLHPFADRASMLPHNVKVYNLALIRKMGLERWATEKAKSVRETYFQHPFDI